MLVSALIRPLKGVMPVSAGRRLDDSNAIPSTSSMPQTCEGGRWLGVAPWEPSFVTPLFPRHLAAALLAWQVDISRISLYVSNRIDELIVNHADTVHRREGA